MKKVAIITSGYFPVPPVKGGAIEALINMLIEENNVEKHLNLIVYSMYDVQAEKKANRNEYTKIVFIKIPELIKKMDLVVYNIAKKVLKKKKHMSYRYILQRIYFINQVSKDLSHNCYDSVIFENHPTLLNALKKYNNFEKYKDKYYYHAHNEIFNTFGTDTLLENVKKYICVSEFIQKSISNKLAINDDDRFVILKNKVDENKFGLCDTAKIKEFATRYNIPKGYTIFTFTGRLNPEKGVKELLEAYRIAHPKKSKLVIAGSYFFGSGMKSNYEKKLEEIAAEIGDDIIFTGNIDYSNMPLLYMISDVIVLPSIWNDPAPLTVIESLTCGKPLITTYSGGIPEYANSNNSLIYRIDENLIQNLAGGITLLANEKNERKRLSDEAKKESVNWTKKSYYIDFENSLK